MTKVNPTIRLMTPDETRTTALMNAGSVIELDGTTIPISAGRRDQVHVFRESTALYVLSTNSHIGYMGLEIFDASSGEEYENIFLQYQWEFEEYLGEGWIELSPIAIVLKLINYLY